MRGPEKENTLLLHLALPNLSLLSTILPSVAQFKDHSDWQNVLHIIEHSEVRKGKERVLSSSHFHTPFCVKK